MKRKTIEQLGPLQEKIMEAVWAKGRATVKEVWLHIDPRKEMAYTTFLSAMQKLEKEGWLKHTAEGKAHVYYPVMTLQKEGGRSLKQLMQRVFQGNPMMLFQQLLEDTNISEDELIELKKLIDKKRREGRS